MIHAPPKPFSWSHDTFDIFDLVLKVVAHPRNYMLNQLIFGDKAIAIAPPYERVVAVRAFCTSEHQAKHPVSRPSRA
jgi:hypothetical protein